MKSNQDNNPFLITGKGGKQSSFTPRELIKYHIENPEEPITDDDINNLNLQRQRVVSFVAADFSRDGN